MITLAQANILFKESELHNGIPILMGNRPSNDYACASERTFRRKVSVSPAVGGWMVSKQNQGFFLLMRLAHSEFV